ncbi:peptidase M28 [Anoxybacillus ayderensis]|uniref:M20/M25/M40 family metallo-hydrolase n=1 Tax=Anoxybacillus ayderensis TaxID=265546 RepID=UPI000386EC2B|nr:M20/M25/M40 family metallo-hydrolase [Anoxybacillus ayderensis]EPZ38349.1 peptidase M28 [Anoxybacillus ayderensis]QAV26932.1 peptidase M28 [Neobacillus thermocopriae]
MKTWNQLFIRQGFILEEKSPNEFICTNEKKENVEFLLKSLDVANVDYTFWNDVLTIDSPPISEKQWLEAVDFRQRGVSEIIGLEEPKVFEVDTYISGVIRELNRLGLYTIACCDGHEKRQPHIYFHKETNMEKVMKLFRALRVNVHLSQSRSHRVAFSMNREQLLDLAENMRKVQIDWLEQEEQYIQKMVFLQELEQLLSVSGESGNEGDIRAVVYEKLKPYVDHLTVDRYGNLLAQKTYKTGHGPTILLNAHLDTVEAFAPGRTIVKQGAIWSSSEGILGADDRAGVAVLLEVAKWLDTSSFNGMIKFVFTVEEECGLVGARNLEEYFLWDVDAAIVVDRRGSGDIVTSCGTIQPFCDIRYGQFFEQVARDIGLTHWTCTAGRSSDTRIWAEHGIQSVNLSAGYEWEHTDDEILDTDACYGTVQLIQAVLNQWRDFSTMLRDLRRGDRNDVCYVGRNDLRRVDRKVVKVERVSRVKSKQME